VIFLISPLLMIACIRQRHLAIALLDLILYHCHNPKNIPSIFDISTAGQTDFARTRT
jgi:hypothetical protein